MWEKAGVNVSVVYGSMPPEAYRAATGTSKQLGKENGAQDRVPFFACGISSVMHPHNPFAPTMHFNYRSVCCARCSHFRPSVNYDMLGVCQNPQDLSLKVMSGSHASDQDACQLYCCVSRLKGHISTQHGCMIYQ